MFLRKQKHIHNHTSKREPNHKRVFSVADFARIAIVIATASALIPANAIAGVDYGNLKKDVQTYRTARPLTSKNQKAAIIPASLGGMARNLPAGIYTASSSVNTSCFNARMVSLLATIQKKYRRPLIITSGFRNPVHNVRVGGVKGSLHLACAAADIKIPGVNKYQLASYVKSLPNHGGVGLYCHDAVHVDIGAQRQWNWCTTGRR